MRRQYCIAGIPFVLQGGPDWPHWRPFVSTEPVPPAFFVDFLRNEEIQYGLEGFSLHSEEAHCYRHGREVMLTDREWKSIRILPPATPEATLPFLVQAYYTHAVRRKMIQMHCSMIDDCGEGVLFLGPSGVGKTTQAELWNRERGARIINGDIGYLQERKGTFWAWGTPWHGSSPYCENAKVPIRALVVLRQSEENTLRLLTGLEKVLAVSESVFYPRWLEDGIPLCLETLGPLLETVPVYQLSCRPEAQAVALLRQALVRQKTG